jgi:putative tryptophan/tyrosine transport system substrate-binding protein
MRRRDFIKVVAGSAMTWPSVARAQQGERMRRVGVLLPTAADDPQYQIWFGAFLQGLTQSGWNIGQNVQIDTRRATASPDAVRKNAAELVALAPDVIFAVGASTVGPLVQMTHTVPIVFAAVADPVGAGFVDALARPGRNVTGFMAFEYGISGKWLEFLKQIVPSLTRAAVLRDAGTPTGIAQFGVIQAMASALRVEITQVDLRDTSEIEHAITAFAGSSNGGLIIVASGLAYIHRDLIIKLAAERRLPAIYFDRPFVAGGGLVSYGPNQADECRRAAGYVDRILKGESPAGMPVQAPTKYELVINLKTAQVLGLTVPQSLLASADEVIE